MILSSGAACDLSDPNHGFYRINSHDTDGYPVYTNFDATPPDSIYKLDPMVNGGPITINDPMGATVADVDADGELDLTVAFDATMIPLFRGNGTWELVDATVQPSPPATGLQSQPAFSWGTAFIDLDMDGRMDLITAHGDDVSSFFAQLMGSVSPTVLWNAGGTHLIDATTESGIDVVGNYRALVPMDLESDGDADFVVGGFGTPPVMLKNEIDTSASGAPGKGFSVSLAGTTSNHLGIGAIIEVVDSRVQPGARVMGGRATPTIVAPPQVFVGVGDIDIVQTVRITWPSGFVQEVADVSTSTHHLFTEPSLVTLTPSDRRASADGAAQIQVEVHPKHPDGTPDPAAVVDIEIKWGAATFLGPAVHNGGTTSRTLVAPLAPGTAVVEVTIDGTPLSVRPRVWWD